MISLSLLAFSCCSAAHLGPPGGADPSQPDGPDANTPLHLLAAGSGNPKLCECLVAHGASTNAVNRQGNTPLHTAIMSAAAKGAGEDNRFDAMACSMVDAKGTQLDKPTAAGETALLLAARRLRARVLRCLLARGANPNTPSTAGELPLIVLLEAAEAASTNRGATGVEHCPCAGMLHIRARGVS